MAFWTGQLPLREPFPFCAFGRAHTLLPGTELMVGSSLQGTKRQIEADGATVGRPLVFAHPMAGNSPGDPAKLPRALLFQAVGQKPTGRGPEDCVENGLAAALLVGYVQHQFDGSPRKL
jgi:hypothetical protein